MHLISVVQEAFLEWFLYVQLDQTELEFDVRVLHRHLLEVQQAVDFAECNQSICLP